MPLFLKMNVDFESVMGIWQTTESEDYFLDRLTLFDAELQEISLLKSRKKLEWLSSRYLLHLISGETDRMPCLKDMNGKPYWLGSDLHISISHSSSYVAVLFSAKEVGIDIQNKVEKIERIASKFVNINEWEFIHFNHKIEMLHVIWGAKEAIYKAHGRKELDFKKHLNIEAFNFNPEGFSFRGSLSKDGEFVKYSLFCRQIEQLILVYAKQVES